MTISPNPPWPLDLTIPVARRQMLDMAEAPRSCSDTHRAPFQSRKALAGARKLDHACNKGLAGLLALEFRRGNTSSRFQKR